MTVLAAAFVIAGLGLVGLGPRRASSHPGVVLILGGIALASFRPGDRTAVVILATVGLMLLGFGVAAFRGRMRPGSADRRREH